MVSIIISTYKQHYLEELKKNIKETIEVPYEIIAVENNRRMGICEAYNWGAENSKYSFLCFVHEDVAFRTTNWTKSLIEKFEEDKNTGLICIAGSKYKSLAPSGWFTGEKSLDFMHILQHRAEGSEAEYQNQNLSGKDFEEVVCADGVFLFTRKQIWNKNKFDQNTFKHFHCYDIDFSLQISRTLKVFVAYTILIEHYSPGSLNYSWIKESLLLSSKWKKSLPAGTFSPSGKYLLEWKNKQGFLYKMIKSGFGSKKVLTVCFSYGFIKFFSVAQTVKTLKLIFVTRLRR